MALTKGLVELLGGRIWLESVLGVGSEFFVELPILQIEEKQSLEVNGMQLKQRIQMELSDIMFISEK